MFSGTYTLAGHTVCIESIYDLVQQMCAAYGSTLPAEATITITPEDLEFETSQSQQANPDLAYLETLAVYRKLANRMLDWNVLLFHGSAVAVDNRCYLFTAKSGTGKSTHVRLWRKLLGSRAVMVNDDKPLLAITPEQVLVYGTPWDGKHHLSQNISVPLQAICLVERGETNRCEEIQPGNILQELMHQSFMPRDARKRLVALSLLDTLCKQVKFYRLQCNMQPEAAKVSYQAMAPQTIEDMLLLNGMIIHGVKGISMEPMLKQDRDLLIVESGKEVHLMDVVLFKRTNGQFVLHRVTDIQPDHYLITGDNCMQPEKVLPHQILGVMTYFIRKGQKHSVTEPGYLSYVKLWHSTYALRRVYNLSTRVWRKLTRR